MCMYNRHTVLQVYRHPFANIYTTYAININFNIHSPDYWYTNHHSSAWQLRARHQFWAPPFNAFERRLLYDIWLLTPVPGITSPQRDSECLTASSAFGRALYAFFPLRSIPLLYGPKIFREKQTQKCSMGRTTQWKSLRLQQNSQQMQIGAGKEENSFKFKCKSLLRTLPWIPFENTLFPCWWKVSLLRLTSTSQIS